MFTSMIVTIEHLVSIFFQYLNDLSCPIEFNDRNTLIDWLLGFAVRLEYGDNGEQ